MACFCWFGNESIREAMNASKHESRLLPVASLLFSATLWGVVWYPLRLLEQQGLAGAWSALISYSAALVVMLGSSPAPFAPKGPAATACSTMCDVISGACSMLGIL